jgi:serpin B
VRPLLILALSASFLACNRGPAGYVPHPDRVARTVTSAEGDVGVVVEGHNELAFRLHASLAAEAGDGNVFASPFSITSVSGMLLAASGGAQRDQLGALLGAPLDGEDGWHGGLGALTRDLSGDLKRAYTLHLANRLYGREGTPFEADFLGVCADDYGAPLESWDFAGDPEGGRVHINGWVAEQTRERIPELLPPGSITADTTLVLVNAITFLADWAVAFDPDDTVDAPFRLLGGGTAEVRMMKRDLEDLDPETPHAIRGARRDGVLVLQLPYEEHEVSMVLLAPEAVELGAFEATLDGATYAGLVADLPLAEGEVGLPRFELRSKIDLIPHAQGLGVTAPFDTSTADFSRLTDPDDGLVITDFLHEAFVRVDERGTEAAAATAAVVGRVSAPEPLVVDRPFVFVIQDDLTGAVLFVGRVTDPR